MVGHLNVQFDLNRLTYREYRAYLAAGDQADDIALMTKIITDWDYPGDPADPASYDDLGMLELLAIQQSLKTHIQEITAGN